MHPIDLSGRVAAVFGVANHRSIAWAIARTLRDAGATVALAYQNERLRRSLDRLVADWTDPILVECDVSRDGDAGRALGQMADQGGRLDIVVHSIAFANREDLGGRFVDTPREGFRVAMDVSAYSLIEIAREAAPLMRPDGGAIVTMTFQAAERVFPGYNVMGAAKAALENEVRQLAADLGPEGVRMNAVSAGPVDTLSSRVIARYSDMKRAAAERAPLGRNVDASDVASTALYLCSDLSAGVTGEVIHVDAGYHVMGI